MSGRKICQECDRKVPVATKRCECGFAFISLKKCFQCGKKVPVARKKCECGNSFNQALKRGFKEMPVVLTSDRLRPRRAFTMNCQFSNGNIYDKHDDMYDKALNDAALESIANSIMTNSKLKQKLDKMYPKRERRGSPNYSCEKSHKKQFFPTNVKTEPEDDTNEDTTSKRPKTAVGIIPAPTNGLKDLIRGEVSKAIKQKMLNESTTGPHSLLSPASVCEDSVTHIKEEVLSDYEYDKSNELSNVTLPGEIESPGPTTLDTTNGESTGEVKNQNDCSSTKGQTPEVIPKLVPEQPIKKKLGRPRKYPISPKGPKGRPRKHVIVEKRGEKKDSSDKYIINEKLNVNEGTNNNRDMIAACSSNNTTSTPVKRGRPKGCKDSKPRKARHDYIERLIEHSVDVDSILSKKKRGRPSLMASDKTKRRMEAGSLNAEEIERVEQRLDKTNPFIIPDNKKELYILILDEVNRRIVSQSFQSTL